MDILAACHILGSILLFNATINYAMLIFYSSPHAKLGGLLAINTKVISTSLFPKLQQDNVTGLVKFSVPYNSVSKS